MASPRLLPRGVLLLAVLLHGAAADARAQGPAPPVVRVEALIDGRSQVRIAADTVQWRHFENAAPGRHWFRDEPTLVNGVPWYPRWPDVPDRENRDCHCVSAADAVLPAPLPLVDADVSLRPVRVRWPPRVVEAPSSANDYATVVEFDDNGFSGPEWWIVEIELRPHAAVFDGFVVDRADVALAGSDGSRDDVGVAGRFTPSAAGDGIDPRHEDVALDLGRLLVRIPAGSFVADGPAFTYRGPAAGAARVDAALEPRTDGGFAFAIRATGTDVAAVRDPETVGLRIGDDEGRRRARFAGRLQAGAGVTVPPGTGEVAAP